MSRDCALTGKSRLPSKFRAAIGPFGTGMVPHFAAEGSGSGGGVSMGPALAQPTPHTADDRRHGRDRGRLSNPEAIRSRESIRLDLPISQPGYPEESALPFGRNAAHRVRAPSPRRTPLRRSGRSERSVTTAPAIRDRPKARRYRPHRKALCSNELCKALSLLHRIQTWLKLASDTKSDGWAIVSGIFFWGVFCFGNPPIFGLIPPSEPAEEP